MKNLLASPELREKAIETISLFQDVSQKHSHAGTLMECVVDFFGGHDKWEDGIPDYQDASVAFLSALANPEFSSKVKEAMGEGHYENLLRMITAAIDLSKFMKLDYFYSMFEADSMEYDDAEESKAKELIHKYSLLRQTWDFKNQLV